MKTDTLLVQGMTCDGCASSVQRALGAIPGVKDVRVDLKKGMVDVDYDPSLTGSSAFAPAIEAAGFDVN